VARPPFILEIRGAGGSGKTTVARAVMSRYASGRPMQLHEPWELETLEKGRRVWWGSGALLKPGATLTHRGTVARVNNRVYGHLLERHDEHGRIAGRPLLAVGKYAKDCGGVDTVANMDVAYEIIRRYHELGFDVLAEGKVLSHSTNERPLRFKDHLVVIFLEVTEEFSFENQVKRRTESGSETDMAKLESIRSNARAEVRAARSFARRLGEEGVEVFPTDSHEAAVQYALERLGLENAPIHEDFWELFEMPPESDGRSRPRGPRYGDRDPDPQVTLW
jgi:hypothetical protein